MGFGFVASTINCCTVDCFSTVAASFCCFVVVELIDLLLDEAIILPNCEDIRLAADEAALFLSRWERAEVVAGILNSLNFL